MKRYQQQYHALGSEVFMTLVSKEDEEYSHKLFKRLRKHVDAFEKQYSRFLPDSELTQFNKRAGERIAISAGLRSLLIAARGLAEETDGLYNPFILPALQQVGYIGSWPQPETHNQATDFTDRTIVPASKLVIGSSWAKIPKNSALDFGGIGKGYLLDELAAKLTKEQLSGYWLSLGGDIICEGYDVNGQPWCVAVQSAVETSKNIDTISNHGGKRLAIATSGTTKRQGLKDGKTWHHIVDPRTGQSADTNVITATVTADQGVIADVYAKCIVIAGPKQAQLYKESRKIRSFLLQTKEPLRTIQS
jgi:thiamine biosynthesis lipoprotein